MRFDSLSMFADNKTVSGTSTDCSTLDIGNAGLSNPHSAWVTVLVQAAFSHDASFDIQGSPDDRTWSGVVSTGTIKVADLAAGKLLNIALPPNCPRYMKLVVKSASSLSSGTITAGIQLAPQTPVEKAVFESAR